MKRLLLVGALLVSPSVLEATSITDVTTYFINDFPRYTVTENGITMGRVHGDPVRVLGSYVATTDTTPFNGMTFTIDPSMMPGASVSSSVTLCLDGEWDISNPLFTSSPTCSSGNTTSLSLHWNASLTGELGNWGLTFSGVTAGAVSFDPVMKVGVLTRVSSGQVENAVEVYWNYLRDNGVPPPFYGPGWVAAEQQLTTVPEPGTLLLLGTGLIASARRIRRHK